MCSKSIKYIITYFPLNRFFSESGLDFENNSTKYKLKSIWLNYLLTQIINSFFFKGQNVNFFRTFVILEYSKAIPPP